MNRLLGFVATIFLTGCAATSCVGPQFSPSGEGESKPYVAMDRGQVYVVVTETPVSATPEAMRVVVAPYGSTPPPKPTCWFYGNGVWKRLVTGEPCNGYYPPNAYAAIPTPQIAMNMGPHESRVYVDWPPCHYGVNPVDNSTFPEADAGGPCPWNSAGYFPGDPRRNQQVGP